MLVHRSSSAFLRGGSIDCGRSCFDDSWSAYISRSVEQQIDVADGLGVDDDGLGGLGVDDDGLGGDDDGLGVDYDFVRAPQTCLPLDEKARCLQKIPVNSQLTKNELIKLLNNAGFPMTSSYYVVQQGQIRSLALMDDNDLLNETGAGRAYGKQRKKSISAENLKKRKNGFLKYLDERLRNNERLDLGQLQNDQARATVSLNMPCSVPECLEAIEALSRGQRGLFKDKESAENLRTEAMKTLAKAELDVRDTEERVKSEERTKDELEKELKSLDLDIQKTASVFGKVKTVHDKQLSEEKGLNNEIIKREHRISILCHLKQGRLEKGELDHSKCEQAEQLKELESSVELKKMTLDEQAELSRLHGEISQLKQMVMGSRATRTETETRSNELKTLSTSLVRRRHELEARFSAIDPNVILADLRSRKQKLTDAVAAADEATGKLKRISDDIGKHAKQVQELKNVLEELKVLEGNYTRMRKEEDMMKMFDKKTLKELRRVFSDDLNGVKTKSVKQRDAAAKDGGLAGLNKRKEADEVQLQPEAADKYSKFANPATAAGVAGFTGSHAQAEAPLSGHGQQLPGAPLAAAVVAGALQDEEEGAALDEGDMNLRFQILLDFASMTVRNFAPSRINMQGLSQQERRLLKQWFFQEVMLKLLQPHPSQICSLSKLEGSRGTHFQVASNAGFSPEEQRSMLLVWNTVLRGSLEKGVELCRERKQIHGWDPYPTDPVVDRMELMIRDFPYVYESSNEDLRAWLGSLKCLRILRECFSKDATLEVLPHPLEPETYYYSLEVLDSVLRELGGSVSGIRDSGLQTRIVFRFDDKTVSLIRHAERQILLRSRNRIYLAGTKLLCIVCDTELELCGCKAAGRHGILYGGIEVSSEAKRVLLPVLKEKVRKFFQDQANGRRQRIAGGGYDHSEDCLVGLFRHAASLSLLTFED